MRAARPAPTLVAALACLLASSALSRLFEGTMWWFGPVLIVVVAAVGTAAIGRLLRLPTGVALLLNLVALVLCVTALCARETAILGFLPTAQTASTLRQLIADGSSDISRLATPVPYRRGVVLLTLVGVYLTAIATDQIAVALERPTLAGLPLLALYAVSAAILPGGVGVIPFALGAAGFVALLLLDGRLTFGRWGRSTSAGTGLDSREPLDGRVTVTALGVAVIALVVAVALPAGLPSLDGSGLVSRKGGYGAGDGPSSASVVQPIVSVSQQLHAENEVALLSVRTDDPRYLRLTALENFDGQLFTLRALNATRDDRVNRGLPQPDITGATVQTSATIAVTDRFNELYLPVPGTPTRIRGLEGDWRLAAPTGTIFSTRTSTAGASYEVDAVVPNPTQAQLQAATGTIPAGLAVDTALPRNLDPRLRTLLREITRDARTRYERVYAIQEYLRGPLFTYDLTGAPTTQEGALAEFLFERRRGYCEQFASAMTVLVRMLGVPARVAIGFVPGEQQADGRYLVTNRQAHAWPEVWFPSVGWLSFEPTRRADGATSAPSYAPAGPTDADPTPATAGPDTAATPTPDPATGLDAAPTTEPTTDAGEAPDPTSDVTNDDNSAGFPSWLTVLLVLALPAVLLLVLPAVIRARRRRSRLRAVAGGAPPGREQAVAQVHAAWAELLDVAADLGVTIRPNDSPRAGIARLTAYLDAEPDGTAATTSAPSSSTPSSSTPSASVSPSSPSSDELTDEPPPRYAEAREALGRIAAAEERARYAPPALAAPPSPAEIARDATAAAAILWSAAPRSRRIVARVFPPSVFRRAEADGLDRYRGGRFRHSTSPPGPESPGPSSPDVDGADERPTASAGTARR